MSTQFSEIPLLTAGNQTSPSAASTVVTTPVPGLAGMDAIKIIGTIAGATGGTLDVYVQTSFDGGVTWYDLVHFTQAAAIAAAVTYSYSIALNDNLVVVGKGTLASPNVALAAGSVAGGPWGDQMRAVFVAGAGTSAGAVQIVDVLGIRRAA